MTAELFSEEGLVTGLLGRTVAVVGLGYVGLPTALWQALGLAAGQRLRVSQGTASAELPTREDSTLAPKAVRNALAASDFNSLYGRIKFADNGQIHLDQTVIQVQNGKPVAVFDGTKFLKDAHYPMPDWTKR